MPIRTFSQYLKNFCMKICKKTLITTENLFNNWGKSKSNVHKTVLLFMRSCSIQSLVLHSDKDHMQNRHHVICGLARGDDQNFSKIVMTKEINHLTLNVNQRKYFQHSACLAQAMAIYKRMASYNFYLNTRRQIKFQRNCIDKKIIAQLKKA